MTAVLTVWASWSEWAQLSVSGGYLVALASICLLQYIVHTYRLSQSQSEREQLRRATESYRSEMAELETELNMIQRDRTLVKLENQILREFVAETECDRALALLLRRYVSSTRDDFAAYLACRDGEFTVTHSRGLFASWGWEKIAVDSPLLEELRKGEPVVLQESGLYSSRLFASLPPADRQRVCQLFLLGVMAGEDLRGIFVTTVLFPQGAPRAQQLELASRLMSSLGTSLERQEALQLHQQQLREASDQLELRLICDRRAGNPTQMLQECLQRAMDKLDAERAALYLATPRRQLHGGPLVQCGAPLPPGVREQWLRHEETLAATAMNFDQLEAYDATDLARIRIDSLIGSALVVPLSSQQRPLGLICFTRRGREAFGPDQMQLAATLSDLLSGQIRQAVDQAAIKRQAQIDALTQLANRRTFDQQLSAGLDAAREAQKECSLVLLDLDRFKSINDTLGHPAGDLVLRRAAHILQEVIRRQGLDEALCARYGGEELAVLLPGTGLSRATQVAEAIRQELEATPIRYQQHSIRVTLSGGVACGPRHGDQPHLLIANADAALYEAKSAGRNQIMQAGSAAAVCGTC